IAQAVLRVPHMANGAGQSPQLEPNRDKPTPSVTAERWQQMKNVFGLALECEPEKRRALLQEVCAGDEALQSDVEALLAAAEGSGGVTSEVIQAALPVPPAQQPIDRQDPMLGRRIGTYLLEERIGFGGMASVYRASRADEEFRKQVAVKLLRPDLDNAELLKRFR